MHAIFPLTDPARDTDGFEVLERLSGETVAIDEFILEVVFAADSKSILLGWILESPCGFVNSASQAQVLDAIGCFRQVMAQLSCGLLEQGIRHPQDPGKKLARPRRQMSFA